MKRKMCFFGVILCLYVFCAIPQTSAQSNNNPNVPSWINDDPPEGMIWGIGLAKLDNNRSSMNSAELRAKRAIVRQLGFETILEKEGDPVFNQLYEYFLLSVADDFLSVINHEIRVLKRWEAPDGNSWCLFEMRKSDVEKHKSTYEKLFQEYYEYLGLK